MEGDPDILDRASGASAMEQPEPAHAHPLDRPHPSDTISTSAEAKGARASSDPLSLDALEQALLTLNLDDRPPNTMFRSLSSIFQAAQMHESHIDVLSHAGGDKDVWAALHHADELESSGVKDVESLRMVKGILDRMFGALSDLTLPATQIVADASRDESWRLPLGESGMLDFGLAAVSSLAAPEELQKQALRLIGNSCADTNENRSRIVSSQHLPTIIKRIQNPRLASVAIPVLYNICYEYEPAQKDAAGAGLFPALVSTLDGGILDSSNPAFGYLCRLVDLENEHLDVSKSPENTVEVLINAATQPNLDVDDMISLVDSATAHLQLENFQQHMLEQQLFGIPLRFLIRSYFPQANLAGAKIPPISGSQRPSRPPDEEAELSRVRKSLIQALSDVSALPEFRKKHGSLDTPLIESVMKWLSASLPQIQLCSCILLGNLARSDEVCTAMVTKTSLHKDAIAILRSSADSSVLHSALGFLRNLALPPANKTILGEVGLMDALTRFWGADFMPQVAHASATVARQLLIGNMPNVKKLLTPLSADEDSPAHSRTYLSLLLSLFEKSDELAVKIEISRTTAGVLRAIHSQGNAEPEAQAGLLQRLYSLHPNVGLPLGIMVSQSRYPVVRSEGWFAMALMARSAEGAALISSVVSEVKVFTALEEAIRGTSGEPESSSSATPITDPATPLSPNHQATTNELKTKDRDNAMILVNELLQHRAGDLVSSIRRSALEELLHAGARLST